MYTGNITKAWDGIPRSYWPKRDLPWRVTWGIGCFSDHKTKAQADRAYKRLLETETGDWKPLVGEPFNVHERTDRMLAEEAA